MARPTGTRKIRFPDRLLAAFRLRRGARRHIDSDGPLRDAVESYQDSLDARERQVIEGIGIDFQKRVRKHELRYLASRDQLKSSAHRSARATEVLDGDRVHYDDAKKAVAKGRLLLSGVAVALILGAVAVEAALIGAAFSVILTDGFSFLKHFVALGVAGSVIYLGHSGGQRIAEKRWRPASLSLGVALAINAALVPLRVAASEAISQATATGGWGGTATSAESGLLIWIAWIVLPIAFSAVAGVLAYDMHSEFHARFLYATRNVFGAWLKDRVADRSLLKVLQAFETRLVRVTRLVEQYLTWAEVTKAHADEFLSAYREELAVLSGTAGNVRRANLRPLGSESSDLTEWEVKARVFLAELTETRDKLASRDTDVPRHSKIRSVA